MRNGITRVIVVQHAAQDSSADRMPELADFQPAEQAAPGATAIHLAIEQSSDLQELLGDGPGIWLVRPDGYLGFRGGQTSLRALANHAQRMGLRAG